MGKSYVIMRTGGRRPNGMERRIEENKCMKQRKR
jgi:hypothetical protein